MKTHYLLPAFALCFVLFGYQPVKSQNVAINATGNTPDASSMLDVQSANKGLLIPQISLTSLSDAATITSPAHSLLVYNTNAALSGGKGYYFNSGTTGAPVWVKLATTSDLLTMTTIGATPNANGGTISSGALSLQPASASFGGIVTTGAQTIAGAKTFSSDLTAGGRLLLPMGEVSYFSAAGSSTSAPGGTTTDGTTNMIKCYPSANPVSSLANDMDFSMPANGRLQYTGATTRTFHVACTISMTPNNSNDQLLFAIAKGGTVISSSRVIQKLGTTSDAQSTALHVMVTLATNEYLELYVGNMTGNTSVKIHSINLFALGM